MSKWDITPSGVEFVTSLVGDAIDDIDTGVRSYGKHVESAAASAGILRPVRSERRWRSLSRSPCVRRCS